MRDIIDLLLQKREALKASKEKAIAEALVKIDDEFADRTNQIERLLATAGYTDPVVVDLTEDAPFEDGAPIIMDDDAPVVDDAPELDATTPDEPTARVVNGRIVTTF